MSTVQMKRTKDLKDLKDLSDKGRDILCSFRSLSFRSFGSFRSFSSFVLFLLLFCGPSLYGVAPPPPGPTPAAVDATNQLLQSIAGSSDQPSLITQATALTLLSLLPFIIMILTSFIKIVVVLSLLRSALGVQQAPPNQIINGIAFLLSLYVMYPTATLMYEKGMEAVAGMKVPGSIVDPESSTYFIKVMEGASDPLRQYLVRNSATAHKTSFYRILYQVLPEQYRKTLKPTDILVVVPAYITTQLKEAFEIGVLIYIPFFVIDLVTSNILLAMGMMMLSPVTISMPLKLFLLVMLDGWSLLIEGLVKTFH